MHYKIVDRAFDGFKFAEFIAELRQVIGEDKGCIYLDNLPVHHCKHVQRTFVEENFTPIYCPPYSPHLNPIENIWSIVKNHYRRKKMLINIGEELLNERALLSEALQQVSTTACINSIRRVLKVMLGE